MQRTTSLSSLFVIPAFLAWHRVDTQKCLMHGTFLLVKKSLTGIAKNVEDCLEQSKGWVKIILTGSSTLGDDFF
jgi:hypothetical protein